METVAAALIPWRKRRLETSGRCRSSGETGEERADTIAAVD
jgi:hypothetical protein